MSIAETDATATAAPAPRRMPSPAQDPAAPEPAILEHEYDGIREYDNPLPGWWMQILYATVIFSACYFVYYHGGAEGRSNADAYEAEAKEASELRARLALSAPVVTTETIASIRADEARLLSGRATFEAKCVACHGPKGGGLVGPNLCDDSWLHGKGRLLDIYGTIREGVPEKGMISWEAQLTPLQLLEVAAYVSSLRGSTPENPKAPQGERVDGIRD